MSGLFGNMGDDPRLMRHALKSRYSAARINLLLMIIFTVVNMITLIINTGGYFLFSAAAPYLLVFAGMLLTGMFPAEMYGDTVTSDMFVDKSVFYGALSISLLIMVIYLLLWIFSKNGKVAFMLTAFVLFAVDTVVLIIFAGWMGNFFLDLLLHIWLLVMLWMGINANKQLAKMPKEDVLIEGEFTDISEEEYENYEESCNSGEALLEEPEENKE